jgi:hypothetical protein
VPDGGCRRGPGDDRRRRRLGYGHGRLSRPDAASLAYFVWRTTNGIYCTRSLSDPAGGPRLQPAPIVSSATKASACASRGGSAVKYRSSSERAQ